MEEQKERLEQELRFLKESLEADVISKDEYEKGKERIEKKLKETEEEEEIKEEKKEEPQLKEQELKDTSSPDSVGSEEIEIKEIKEKPIKIIGVEEKIEEQKEPKEKKQTSKKWLYGLAILIIIATLFFSMRGCKQTEDQSINKFIPICSLNSDCKQEGRVGNCLNPGAKESKCEFKEDIKTELRVINDKDCKLCDSSRMKTGVKEIFPNVRVTEIDYREKTAKELINKLNIEALPAYIFDSNVSEAINFNDFKIALIKKQDNYLITDTASGANYYFNRENIENKLDLFLTNEIEEKTDKNIDEFLELFSSNIHFTKQIVTEIQKSKLKKELGITSYPAFLVNNQFKVGGFQSANSIKDKFCELNTLSECKTELRKSII